MRNSRLLFAAAGLLLAVSANAQETPGARGRIKELVVGSSHMATSAVLPVISGSSAEVEYRIIDSLANGLSYYSNRQQPLVWDPVSNITATIKRGRPGHSGEIYILISRDNGHTWTDQIGPLHSNAVVGNGRYPSLAISNPTNTATNLSDIYIFFTFPILDPSAFGSFISGFITADATTPAVTDVLSHDINGVRWSTSARTVFSNSGTTAITIGEMDDNSFGVRRFDLDAGTETTFVPASLSYTNFAGPDPTTGGGVITGLDKDQNGGIYVGLTATTTSDTNNYYLQVAKSTDDGVTWSALEMAPISLWQNYMRGLGANLDSSFLSFRSGFAVTGVDEYSFVAQALESNEDNQNNVRQLVEIYKKAGQWGIRKIADISGLSFLFDSDGSGTRAVSQLGNELQLSRTPDRSKLLVKYQDLISYTSNNDLNGDGQTPDTLLNTSDIFVNARDISSSTWSDQQNVTETLFLDRLSWIAPLVPNDLKDIPLLTVQGGFTDDQTTDSARIYAAQFVLVGPTQFVAISNFEAATTSGVREDAAVAASALKIFPNPATSQARASFSLPVAGQVSVRIHDVTGNEIFSLPAQQMTAGTHSVPFNTESLANGAYYYTVTVNGTVSSAMFTVVR